MRTHSAALLLAVAVAGAVWAFPAAQAPGGAGITIAARRNDVAAALEKAQVVFVGDIDSVGAPPRVRTSSKALATQPVYYRVLQVLKGSPPRELLTRFTVRHGILASGQFVEPTTASPAGLHLSPNVFKPGARVIVMANEVERTLRIWHLSDPEVGVWPATDQNLAEISKLLVAR